MTNFVVLTDTTTSPVSSKFYDSITLPMTTKVISDLPFLEAPYASPRGIVRTSTGRIYIAYHDFTSNILLPPGTSILKVDYTDDNGITFTNSLSLTLSYVDGFHEGWTLAVDSHDNIYLAYIEKITPAGQNSYVYYSKFNGVTWSAPAQVAVSGALPSFYLFINIVADKNDKIYITWEEYKNVGSLRVIDVAEYSSGTWNVTQINDGIGGSQGTGLYPALAVDSLNQLHLTYYGYNASWNSGNGFVAHVICVAGIWGAIGTAVNLAGNEYLLNGAPVVVDSSNEIHICYDYYFGAFPNYHPKLMYARTIAGVWQVPEVVIDKSALKNTYSYGSISLDGNNPVIVAEIPTTNSGTNADVMYFYKSGGVWTPNSLEANLGVNFLGNITTLDKIGIPILLPTVTTGVATNITEVSATLNGQLTDDGGEACTCGFEWGLTNAYGNTTPTTSQHTGDTFSQVISSLAPSTIYHFRAFATNSAGTSYGVDVIFNTPTPGRGALFLLMSDDNQP